jgi:hypothetical protein
LSIQKVLCVACYVFSGKGQLMTLRERAMLFDGLSHNT